MIRTSHPVLRALHRWEAKGLLSPDTAEPLRREVEGELRREGRRWSQYLLAATGGAVLIIAGSTFLAWVWPGMGPAGRSLILGAIGLAILGLGLRMPGTGRWAPVAFLLQLCGPVLIFFAMMYSAQAWPDGSAGGIAMGSVGLVLPPVLVYLGLRKHPALAALQLALGFLFLYGFFARALNLPEQTFLWILDGLLLVGLAFLGTRLQDPEGPDWAMPMFASLCLSAFVLLAISGEVIWHMDAYTVIPMDLWLIIVAGLAFWGQQEDAPAHLRRDWFEIVLALCVLAGIVFALTTTLEAFATSPEVAALSVAAVGGLGLWYSLPRGSRVVLVASCIAFLIAAWYYGAEKGGALGSVLALTVMAVVLFWGSSRVGAGGDSPSSAASA
jgi:hypothetical protein